MKIITYTIDDYYIIIKNNINFSNQWEHSVIVLNCSIYFINTSVNTLLLNKYNKVVKKVFCIIF